VQEGLKDLSMQEESMSTQDLVSKEVLPFNPLKEHQQCEVIMLREDKNKNGKRNPETQITGKNARNLNRKKSKLQEAIENRRKTLQETDLQNLNPTVIAEPCRMEVRHGEAI
jgi:hypothetical protein